MRTIHISKPQDLAFVFDELICEFMQDLMYYQGPHLYACELDSDEEAEENWALINAGCSHVFLEDGNRLIDTYIARAKRFIKAKFPEAEDEDFTIQDPRTYP